jgi:murein DD-endopeptidase MepM/ murein hydrolase activator NlpD
MLPAGVWPAGRARAKDWAVIRSVALSAFGALALAGCASVEYEGEAAPVAVTPAPVQPTPPTASTIDPQIYLNAPHAPLLSQLFVCSPNESNIGPISADLASLAYTPYISTPAGSLLRDPTEGGCLSSGFGWRNRSDGGGSNHTGIDLANPNGGFIFAAADGTVTFSGWYGGYGQVVELDHGRGVHTLYGHLSEISPLLSPGSFVHAGTAIARMGMTGNATGVHLHYEVSIDGLKVDPLNYGAPQVVEVGQSHDQTIDQPRPAPDADSPQPQVEPAPDSKSDTTIVAPPQPGVVAAPFSAPDADGWSPNKPK